MGATFWVKRRGPGGRVGEGGRLFQSLEALLPSGVVNGQQSKAAGCRDLKQSCTLFDVMQ